MLLTEWGLASLHLPPVQAENTKEMKEERRSWVTQSVLQIVAWQAKGAPHLIQ